MNINKLPHGQYSMECLYLKFPNFHTLQFNNLSMLRTESIHVSKVKRAPCARTMAAHRWAIWVWCHEFISWHCVVAVLMLIFGNTASITVSLKAFPVLWYVYFPQRCEFSFNIWYLGICNMACESPLQPLCWKDIFQRILLLVDYGSETHTQCYPDYLNYLN